MIYPPNGSLKKKVEFFCLYAKLKCEYGAAGAPELFAQVEHTVDRAIVRMRKMSSDAETARRRPDDLDAIRALRPRGPRQLWQAFHPAVYRERLTGALLSRLAGCTLGAPVEFNGIDEMENLARENGEPFPPVNYWSYVPKPFERRYDVSQRQDYTRGKMRTVPVDDDITYTLLGLLVVEEHGLDFTVEDIGASWVKYLPYACTAEEVALTNLRRGVIARRAADVDNPYTQWIGAGIRADPWGYIAPGYPEKAAEFAHRDACLSHRGEGIYGAMFFAAAISAAFAVNDPVDALRIGLTEIPRECDLADAVRWALRVAPRIRNHRQAREAVDKHCGGMSGIHTINNACLTVFGLALGGTDVTRVIGTTVAMGLDNDCNAATAGSIAGATVGMKGVPSHWYRPFRNTIRTYLRGRETFRIDDAVRRFTAQARKVLERPVTLSERRGR